MSSIRCSLSKFLMTDDLNQLCKKNKHIRKYFVGTFPADVFPKIKKKDICCWIWNTDEQNQEGQHWIAIWKNKKKLLFFDSYGKKPSFYNRKYWYNFAKQNNSKLRLFSNKRRQNINTTTCGVWCLIFLIQKSTNINILKLLTSAFTMKNDKTLLKIALLLFSDLQIIYGRKCRNMVKKSQKCCSLKRFIIK